MFIVRERVHCGVSHFVYNSFCQTHVSGTHSVLLHLFISFYIYIGVLALYNFNIFVFCCFLRGDNLSYFFLCSVRMELIWMSDGVPDLHWLFSDSLVFHEVCVLCHETGVIYVSFCSLCFYYRSEDHSGGLMLQVSWGCRQVLVWHRVKRDSCHLRSITRTFLYICMHFRAHISPPPNLIEMNLCLAPAKMKLI